MFLDLGSGKTQNLARDVEAKGLHARVISLDPSLSLHSQRRLESRKINNRYHPFVVAALSTGLPFADKSFDKIFCLYSVPFYSETVSEFLESLFEMIRVLKLGGEIMIYPLESVATGGSIMSELKPFLEGMKGLNIDYKVTGGTGINQKLKITKIGTTLVERQ